MVFFALHNLFGINPIYRKLTAKFCGFTWVKAQLRKEGSIYWMMAYEGHSPGRYYVCTKYGFGQLMPSQIKELYYYYDGRKVRIKSDKTA